VHIYLNHSDGSWSQSFGFLGGNTEMAIDFGDVNGDGWVDFAVTHQYGTVYLGDGTGGFSLADGDLPDPGLSGLAGVALGDVDNDGLDDLSFCNAAGGVEVWTWEAPGDWQDISGNLPGSGGCEATQLFDMDNDGWRDVTIFGNGDVIVWGGDGAGNWTELASFSTPAPGYLSAFCAGGDADHNGYADIVLVADEGNWPNDQNKAHFYKEASTPAEAAIIPVFPHGAETFLAGGVIFIDWLSANPYEVSGSVNLELSLSGFDGPWTTIGINLVDNGRWQWTIPADTPTTDDAVIRYTLEVSSTTTSALTPATFHIIGGTEAPISGLTAFNDSPTVIGGSTLLSATVEAGTNVSYAWDFGDGDMYI
jgi:hypothetical protein